MTTHLRTAEEDEEEVEVEVEMEMEREARPVTCEICQENICSASLLTAHRRLHKAVHQHVCSLCEKRFSTKKNLKRHVR